MITKHQPNSNNYSVMITKHQPDSHNCRVMITKHQPISNTLLIHSTLALLILSTLRVVASTKFSTHRVIAYTKFPTLSQVTSQCTISAYGWFISTNALMKCQHAMLQELRFTTHTQTSIRHFIKQLKCTIRFYYSNDSKTFSNHPKQGETPSHNHKTCQRKHFQKGIHNTLQFHLKLPFQPNNSFLIFAKNKQSQSIEISI